jgi:hypothetical protein
MKTLEINSNYGGVFGLNTAKGQQMIYKGGDTWTMREGDREKTIESPDTTKKALAYINQPTIHMGR